MLTQKGYTHIRQKLRHKGVKKMEWTVEELINELQKVEDKTKKIRLSVNDIVRRNFHINDAPVLYLSNANEKGYKPQDVDWSEIGL